MGYRVVFIPALKPPIFTKELKKRVRRGFNIFAKLILLILVVYAVVSLLTLREKADVAAEENASLQQQVDALRVDNEELEYEIAHSEDEETKVEIARDKLGLVLPGEKVFYNTAK